MDAEENIKEASMDRASLSLFMSGGNVIRIFISSTMDK
jgi:hypothetical protein